MKQIGDQPLPPVIESQLETKPEYWNAIFEGMSEVMHGARGTARRAAERSEYRMAGKSGTAQAVGIAQNAKYNSGLLKERHRDHALFVAFAPVENPQIAVAVMLENAEGGSSQAAPVARAMMDALHHDMEHVRPRRRRQAEGERGEDQQRLGGRHGYPCVE